MVENMHATHDQPFATKQNGFAASTPELLINGEFGSEAHRPARRLAEGQRLLLRRPAGTADPKFINGDCAM